MKHRGDGGEETSKSVRYVSAAQRSEVTTSAPKEPATLPDRLFAEAESGWLWDRSANEPGLSAP